MLALRLFALVSAARALTFMSGATPKPRHAGPRMADGALVQAGAVVQRESLEQAGFRVEMLQSAELPVAASTEVVQSAADVMRSTTEVYVLQPPAELPVAASIPTTHAAEAAVQSATAALSPASSVDFLLSTVVIIALPVVALSLGKLYADMVARNSDAVRRMAQSACGSWPPRTAPPPEAVDAVRDAVRRQEVRDALRRQGGAVPSPLERERPRASRASSEDAQPSASSWRATAARFGGVERPTTKVR